MYFMDKFFEIDKKDSGERKLILSNQVNFIRSSAIKLYVQFCTGNVKNLVILKR